MNLHALLKSFFSVQAGLLVFCLWGTTFNAPASDTNVFLAKSNLTGDALSSQVSNIKAGEVATLLGSTNANLVIALSVRDFDALPTGLRPVVEIVLFNQATSAIVETLVVFDLGAQGNVPLYAGSRTVTARAQGTAGSGLVAANVNALITFTRSSAGPTKLTVAPLGALTYNDGTNDQRIILQSGQLKASGAPIVVTP